MMKATPADNQTVPAKSRRTPTLYHTMKYSEFAEKHGIKASTKWIGAADMEGCHKHAQKFTVTLTCGGRKAEFDWTAGPGVVLPGFRDPRTGHDVEQADATSIHSAMGRAARKYQVAPADILYSLALDSSALDQPFEDWAPELGYDPDSRKAEAIYDACQASAFKLKRLLGGAVVLDELRGCEE